MRGRCARSIDRVRADRRDALDRRGPWFLDNQILVGKDPEAARRRQMQKFPRVQQEIRVGRLAEAFVANGEGFVDQHAARRDGVQQMRRQWAMEIVHDHDLREASADQGKRTTIFQIRLDHLGSRVTPQVRQLRDIPVDSRHLMPALQEEPGMPATTSGDVQNRTGPSRKLRKTKDPG